MTKDWTSDLTSTFISLPQPTPPVLLGSHLWFDPPNRILWRKRKRVLLTPREAQTLILLLRAPGCYLTAGLMAGWLSPPNGKPVFEHSIEQTISGLRRKLSESGKRQYITYKAAAAGIAVTLIEEAYTSQTCPRTLPDGTGCLQCYKPKGRVYRCPACGFTAHRDGVGCINLLSQHYTGEPGHVVPPREKYRYPYVGEA